MKLLLMLLLIISCGRNTSGRSSNNCVTREHMRTKCQTQMIPNYGYHYAQDYCYKEYEVERCYHE